MLEESRLLIEKMRFNYCKTTGIESLKIIHNNVLGLFIEVSSRHAAKMNDPRFIHLSTTAFAVRFTTEGLKQVESKMVGGKTLAIGLEKEIFEQICCKILMQTNELRGLALRLAELDVFCAMAFVAGTYSYVKPEMADNEEFSVSEGRHLIAERNLEAGSFVANDCDLSLNQRLWLITGPNMAGKSTFLRQNAIIAILAQAGSFVPADRAKIGIIDKIFSRISFGDDIAKGQSTFMVEMLEMANILNSATHKSFIILDEVGRGTAAHDGLAIAQSCMEYIHNKIKCRCLFATHFHELINLKDLLPNMRNFSTEVIKEEGLLKFMHKMIPGGATKSYGVYVAELAGLPQSVISRAKEIVNF